MLLTTEKVRRDVKSCVKQSRALRDLEEAMDEQWTGYPEGGFSAMLKKLDTQCSSLILLREEISRLI